MAAAPPSAVSEAQPSVLEEPKPDSAEAQVLELQKKLSDAFDLFDEEGNKQVDVREIGTIFRSLGLCPSESELQDLIAQMEDEEPTGYIRLEKFMPVATAVMLERRYRPASEDVLLRAFKVLDTEGKGFLTTEELTKYMTEEGEPLTQEELDDMIHSAFDTEKQHVNYKEYVSKLVVADT